MATPHSHPHKKTRKKTPQEIAFAKIKKSKVGSDGMTAFARKGFIGGSADQAKRAAPGKARTAAKAATAARTRKRQATLREQVAAANKRIREKKAAKTYKGRG